MANEEIIADGAITNKVSESLGAFLTGFNQCTGNGLALHINRAGCFIL